MQKERENFYLKEYLPLLNTVFKSNFSESLIYDNLYNKLKTKQGELKFNSKYSGLLIYVYNYTNGLINPNFSKYNSFNALSKEFNIARDTIKRYLNTNVPYKNNLFFTNIITDFTLINDLVSKASLGLELDRSLTKKVWIYNEKGEKFKFESKEAVAKFFNVQFVTITYHLDN